MEKQIIMLHKGWVHLFWTGGQSAALCQQPKPTHNSPKDDYANASQPSYFPRNRRRAPSRSYNCFAVMWKNKQFFLAGGRVFSLRALLQYVWDIQTHTHTHTQGAGPPWARHQTLPQPFHDYKAPTFQTTRKRAPKPLPLKPWPLWAPATSVPTKRAPWQTETGRSRFLTRAPDVSANQAWKKVHSSLPTTPVPWARWQKWNASNFPQMDPNWPLRSLRVSGQVRWPELPPRCPLRAPSLGKEPCQRPPHTHAQRLPQTKTLPFSKNVQ